METPTKELEVYLIDLEEFYERERYLLGITSTAIIVTLKQFVIMIETKESFTIEKKKMIVAYVDCLKKNYKVEPKLWEYTKAK